MSDPVRDTLRARLAEQTHSFLSQGGAVTSVPTGRSGEALAVRKSQWTKASARAQLAKV
ncbi:hypothetical protein [Pseudomonas sp. LRF_L74]|uniref:hypothetical protein n=1 Tax=Pseudomonas sp. LRF_L74 TaxID=3369422 RepID=UPI003F613D2D